MSQLSNPNYLFQALEELRQSNREEAEPINVSTQLQETANLEQLLEGQINKNWNFCNYMTTDKATLSEWADQYRAEVEKLVANRVAKIEELLLVPDYESAVDWIQQWKEEDSEPDSAVQKYLQTLEKLRLAQQSQETTGEASADSFEG